MTRSVHFLILVFVALGVLAVSVAQAARSIEIRSRFDHGLETGAAGALGAAATTEGLAALNKAVHRAFGQFHATSRTAQIDTRFAVLSVSWNHAASIEDLPEHHTH